MANIKIHRPVLLVAAMFAEKSGSLDWACEQLEKEFGAIAVRSIDIPFDQTRFYESEMGQDLTKRFLGFSELFDPAKLCDIKIRTNELEQELAASFVSDVSRPINIDPGYITEAKLVLATTKDRDHRIYIGKGIYAEITLFFQQHQWRDSRWTYPDYKSEPVLKFAEECRQNLRTKYQLET